jgi:GNAT superfamily N-acetyltransferase
VADVRIRPYEAGDRPRVREICFVTGHMGDRVDWMWADTESWADIFSGYYTDAEPESAFVVEVDGVVGGYLLGCVDATGAWNPARVAGRHIVRRGILFRRGTAPTLWRVFGDAIVDITRRRVDPRRYDFADPRWPAHLHIDLVPEARGLGAGRLLMREWFERLRSFGIDGCYLQTFAENTGAIAFFEAVGFRRWGEPVLVPGFRTRAGGRMHEQVMVIELDPGGA